MSESEQIQSGEAVQPDAGVVGLSLREAREARGLTVANIAQLLKLSARQIEAMEAGRFDQLPGPAFVRGFVRNYARQLGIDYAPLLAALDADARVSGKVELKPLSNAEGVMPVSGERSMSATPVALVAFGLLLVVLAAWYFDWFRTPSEPAPVALEAPADEAFPPPSALPPGEAAAEPAASGVEPAPTVPGEVISLPPGMSPPTVGSVPAPAPAPEAAPAAVPAATTPDAAPALVQAPAASAGPLGSGDETLELRFTGESWFEVRDAAGAIVATGTGSAGQSRSVRGTLPLALVIGNAAQVRLQHNGQPVDLGPHTKVSVARLTLK